MSYRALYAADVHVGNTLPYARRDKTSPYTDRLIDSLSVLDQMADYAEANGITDIWYLGDLGDKRLMDGATFKALGSKLIELSDRGLFQRAIPGNHEASDASGHMYTIRGFEGIRPNIEIWDETTRCEPTPGLMFRGVPYKPDEVAREIVERIREEEANTPTVLLLHQSLVGGKVGSWINPDGITPDDLDGFHSVLAGHFHTPQELSAAPLRMYLGAPLQHNFGDSGEQRGFWDITYTAKGVKAKLIKTAMPEFRKCSWDKLPDDFKEGDYLQLETRGTATELKRIAAGVKEAAEAALARGARAVKVHPTTITERKTRAKVAEEGGKVLTWPEAVSGYVDACDVTGLSRAKLEAMAREALAEAE